MFSNFKILSIQFWEKLEKDNCFFGSKLNGSIFFQNVKFIGKDAFQNSNGLKGLNFSNVTFIGDSAFDSQSLSGPVYFEKVQIINDNAFCGCKFGPVYFINVKTIGAYSFKSSTIQGLLSMHNVENIGNYAFWHSKIYDSSISIENVYNMLEIMYFGPLK